MEFLNMLGALIIMAGVVFVFFYGMRHRGSIVKWVNNLDHPENSDDKDGQIIKLRREKEDIETELAKIEGD